MLERKKALTIVCGLCHKRKAKQITPNVFACAYCGNVFAKTLTSREKRKEKNVNR